MRIQKSIYALLLQLLVLTAIAAAQDKNKLAPLPSDASLADSQEWIVKNLGKNFGYSTIDDSVKVSNLKFEGCTLSYRVLQRYTDQKAKIGDRPALGVTGARTATDITYSVHEDVWVDLKQIDAAKIALGPLPEPKSMQVIHVPTLGMKDAIKFDRQGTTVRYNATGMRNTTLFPVKESAGESLARALIHTVKLCQAN